MIDDDDGDMIGWDGMGYICSDAGYLATGRNNRDDHDDSFNPHYISVVYLTLSVSLPFSILIHRARIRDLRNPRREDAKRPSTPS